MIDCDIFCSNPNLGNQRLFQQFYSLYSAVRRFSSWTFAFDLPLWFTTTNPLIYRTFCFCPIVKNVLQKFNYFSVVNYLCVWGFEYIVGNTMTTSLLTIGLANNPKEVPKSFVCPTVPSSRRMKHLGSCNLLLFCFIFYFLYLLHIFYWPFGVSRPR